MIENLEIKHGQIIPFVNLVNEIYLFHDNNLNKKYKVEINEKTIERVKNSF